ncbi:MAG: hypothetical protein AB7O96_15455 [Pseudobdellovibrionaceae bacterium]
MKTNTRKVSIILPLSLFVGVFVVFGNGCSPGKKGSSSSASSAPEELTCTVKPAPVVTIDPNAPTASVVYANQALDHYMSCSGLIKASDKTLLTYENKKGAISTYGAYDSVTPPMLMAITSIVGEVCDDLIEQEKASGERLFVGFDLGSNALPVDSAIRDSITRLALSCWQRQDSSEERQILLDMVYDNVQANEEKASRKTALMICTSMLSSLDALTN